VRAVEVFDLLTECVTRDLVGCADESESDDSGIILS